MKANGQAPLSFIKFIILPVNLSAMAGCQDQYDNFFILDFTQYAVISNPVSPETDTIAL